MQKTLYKSKKNRVFCGVAGGLAEYFDQDPSIMRLLFVLLTVFSGSGIILYIVACLVVPEEPANLKKDKK